MHLNRTSNFELDKLLNDLKIKDYVVVSRDQLNDALQDSKIKNIICNLGNSTHWVAIYKPKKIYFDSFGQVPIPEVSTYKHSNKIIQGIEDQDCGQLCCLFLWYANNSTTSKFFNLFKSRYDYK